ncbi:MAG: hypothetical protein WC976_06225 [Caldisericia bacterium]
MAKKTKGLAEILEKEFNKSKIPNAEIEFEDYTDKEVEISHLKAIKRNRGSGTATMNKVIEIADKNDIKLMLIPCGEPGTRWHNSLVRFYERFGFRQDSEDVMRR